MIYHTWLFLAGLAWRHFCNFNVVIRKKCESWWLRNQYRYLIEIDNANQFKHLQSSANHGQYLSRRADTYKTNYDSFHLNVKYLNNCYLIVILVMRDCWILVKADSDVLAGICWQVLYYFHYIWTQNYHSASCKKSQWVT